MSKIPDRGLAKVNSCAVIGLDGALVNVEVDVANGAPMFIVVGLPDAAVQETRERVPHSYIIRS